MFSFYSISSFVLASLLSTAVLGQDENNPCKSYGIDFQHEGAYFQDGNSSEPFTFVSEFEGRICNPGDLNQG